VVTDAIAERDRLPELLWSAEIAGEVSDTAAGRSFGISTPSKRGIINSSEVRQGTCVILAEVPLAEMLRTMRSYDPTIRERYDEVALDRREGLIEVIEKAPGDGTVLRSSALLDERVGRDVKGRLDTPLRVRAGSLRSALPAASTVRIAGCFPPRVTERYTVPLKGLTAISSIFTPDKGAIVLPSSRHLTLPEIEPLALSTKLFSRSASPGSSVTSMVLSVVVLLSPASPSPSKS